MVELGDRSRGPRKPIPDRQPFGTVRRHDHQDHTRADRVEFMQGLVEAPRRPSRRLDPGLATEGYRNSV